MVSAYVVVSVEAGKNQDVLPHSDRLPASHWPTPAGPNPTSSPTPKPTSTVP
jgi:hypothetical protein